MEKKTPEQIAKETLDKMNKEKAETKGAASEPSTEKPKTEEQKKQDLLKEAEVQAKKDEAILSKKDEELSKEDQERKKVLLNKSSEDKVGKRKQEIQQEIDELVSKKKSLELEVSEKEKITKDLGVLRKEKEELEKKLSPKKEEDEAVIEDKLESERIAKFLEEDKGLQKEKRRELSETDLEDWLLEDLPKAQEWLIQRTLRRNKEKNESIRKKQEDKFIQVLLDKQHESALRVEVKHPDLNPAKREKELQEQGKTKQEIFETLCKENKKYKICADIIKEKPDFLLKENAPELIAEEMEKRLKVEEPIDESEVEKLKKQIEEKEAEIQRLKGLDEGLSSSAGKVLPKNEQKTEIELLQEKIALKAGISPEQLKKAKERRSKMPGVI